MSTNQNFIQLGQALKEGRENQGITLEQIANKTKIGVPILQSIEEAQITTKQLPFVYLRSFILAYAKVIGLNIKDVEKELKISFTDENNIPSSGSTDTEQFIEKDLHLTPIILAISILIIIGVILMFSNITQLNKIDSLEKAQIENKKASILEELQNQIPTVPDKPSDSFVQRKLPSTQKNIYLEIIIKALKPVTVFYQVDINTIKTISLRKDQFQVLKGKNNISIRTNNSDYISIFRDGKALGIFGSGGTKEQVFLKKHEVKKQEVK